MLYVSLKRFATIDKYVALFRMAQASAKRVIDVGACIGTYSLLFNRAWPDAEIIAIEPSSHSFEYLLRNTLHVPQIRQYQLAMHDKTETLDVAIPSEEQKSFLNMGENNCGIVSVYGESDILRNQVLALSLDDLVDTADFIKIDAEGHDYAILQGAERILTESRPVLMVEFIHANFAMSQTTPQQILDYLASLGYYMSAQILQDVFFTHKDNLPPTFTPSDFVLRQEGAHYKVEAR